MVCTQGQSCKCKQPHKCIFDTTGLHHCKGTSVQQFIKVCIWMGALASQVGDDCQLVPLFKRHEPELHGSIKDTIEYIHTQVANAVSQAPALQCFEHKCLAFLLTVMTMQISDLISKIANNAIPKSELQTLQVCQFRTMLRQMMGTSLPC